MHDETEAFIRRTILAAGRMVEMTTHSQRTASLDMAVEQFLAAEIGREYPEHQILSEESHRSALGLERPTWILDPIDGSLNLYRGAHPYGVCMSLITEGQARFGAIYEPYLDQLYFASRGEGATRNGRPLAVSSTGDIANSVVAISSLRTFHRGQNGGTAYRALTDAFTVRISGSTAIDMCYVASGALDARVMADTRIWDYSAAALLIQESGGQVTDWCGAPPTPDSSRLIASNGRIHGRLIDILEAESSAESDHD
jgi:myo-inositol-1(or 4)-monophosphatase